MSEKDFLCALSDLLDEKLDEKLEPINTRLKRLEMTVNHDVVPRLQNIETCYLTTFERYCWRISCLMNLIRKWKRGGCTLYGLQTTVSSWLGADKWQTE